MFSIPNLAWARTTSTYSQLFVYTALWNIGLLGLLLAGLFLLCLVLKVYLLKQHENKLLTESIITLEERDSTVRIS